MAIADFESGVYKSAQKAALAYGVPPLTLNNRLNGKLPKQIAYQHEQRLTPTQEAFLTNQVLEQDLQGFAPLHTRLQEIAARILD